MKQRVTLALALAVGLVLGILGGSLATRTVHAQSGPVPTRFFVDNVELKPDPVSGEIRIHILDSPNSNAPNLSGQVVTNNLYLALSK